MNFLDKHGLGVFLAQLKNLFGFKSNLDESMEARRTYLLEIDYDKDLAFDVSQIVGDVGQFDYTTFENFVLT